MVGISYSVEELKHLLQDLSGQEFNLQLTDNTSRMLSYKKVSNKNILRLQRIFLSAPYEVLEDIAKWLHKPRDAGVKIREFIRIQQKQLSNGKQEKQNKLLSTQGKYHDLAKYFSKINSIYLQNRSKSSVTWGYNTKPRLTSSIRFGCYNPRTKLITINRRLDKKTIPAYFIEYILFHEMLHEILGTGKRSDGKRDIHGKLFKLMESTYPDYEKACQFEKKIINNFAVLLIAD